MYTNENARYIVCPDEYQREPGRASVFLAGGITGCWDWQSRIAGTPLGRLPVDLLNPRRRQFDITNPVLTQQQIAWEFHHLRAADAILFWFCADQIQPIALFELGAHSMTHKPLFVGCDAQYPRRADVIEQMRLVRPGLEVGDMGLAALCWDVEAWFFDWDQKRRDAARAAS